METAADIITRLSSRAARYEMALTKIAGSRHTDHGDEPNLTSVEAMTTARIVISEMQKGAGQ